MSVSNGKTRVLGLSDALTIPTGFAHVASGLFSRLPRERFDLAYLAAGGWSGTARFGFPTYTGAGFCQDALPRVAYDFAGREGRLVLWTLMDLWQLAWLAEPTESPLSTPDSLAFLSRERERITWVGYFPIDGHGPGDGPPRWTAPVLDAMDVPVAMSEWGRRICQPLCKKEIRTISHAVDLDIFTPEDKESAKAALEASYALVLAASLPSGSDAKMLARRMLRLQGCFVVLCLMANRERKLWWDVLRAFKVLSEKVPSARLVGICGTRGTGDGGPPLEELCADLGLRMDAGAEDPQVWLIERVVDADGLPDEQAIVRIWEAADCAILLSGGEGFGLPQLQAHAMALPCVVGNYSASSELAVDPRELVPPRGYYVTGSNQVRRPVYSPRDAAARLIWAAENPSWRREVGARGRAQAEKRSWERVLPRWIDVLSEAGGEKTLPAEKEEASEQVAVGGPS